MVPEETNSAKIAVIILTVNQRENTIQCLSSFKSVESPPHHILLWDNGSTDGTAETVREAFPEVLVHSHPMNIGAAAGRNEAAHQHAASARALNMSHGVHVQTRFELCGTYSMPHYFCGSGSSHVP